MKILYVVNTYYPDVNGGAPKSVQMLAQGMVADGNDVVVVRLTDNKRIEKYEHNGVKVYSLPIRNIYMPREEYSPSKWKRLLWHLLDIFNPMAAYDFWKILKKEQPDVVNTNTVSGFSTSIFHVTKMMKIKLVHTMRDYYLMCPKSGMYREGKNCEVICKSCKPFAYARKLASKNVDTFLGNSQFVVDRHKQQMMIPYNAACYNQWNTNGDDDISKVRTFIEPGRVRFGYIGRINELKGVDVLIEACAKLNEKNWCLQVAGTAEPEFLEGLKAIAPEDQVVFLDWVSAKEFYASIDVLICPSTYHDPLPRVVYEAYKYGIPVIAGATGGTPEMVDHGETGYLYDAKDVSALASLMDATCYISESEYMRLSEHAITKSKLFTRTNILNSYKKRIKETLRA